ncbi:tetratricopeptide repeat protein [bacterium]|nr:tetratricopeptide repeat protein [bacterium]
MLISNPSWAIKSNHGLDGFVVGKIDATKNARLHSNMGNIYFDEGKYISALKEYEIAYNLAYDTQASGAYLHNIARCFFVMGNFALAKNAIEGAILKDCINLTYYEMLAECIIKLGIENSELKKYISDTTNPYNRIVVGLIYLKTGHKMQARATFDDFIYQNPDMIITQDIKVLLERI